MKYTIYGNSLIDLREVKLMATQQQWSQSYFTNLTPDQHDANNNWFQSMRDRLTDSGILYVPILDKEFNKSGEEVNTYNSNKGD